MAPTKQKHFDIDASIVFQLGEDLITDVVQALIELAKNAYDADATYVKITIETDSEVREKDSYFQGAVGFVMIEDNGTGMNDEAIQKGWLTISKSPKREMKRKKVVTSKGRTPLGDKGLGRLGAQRLGGNIELFTTQKGTGKTHHVGWSWQAFRKSQTLTQVPIEWRTRNGTAKNGTKLIISGLRDADQWKGDTLDRVATGLSQMISPYSKIADFRIICVVNGKQLELAEVSERIRNFAQVRYKLQFDEKSFRIDGRARLDLIRPSSPTELQAFEQLVDEDGGKAFYNYLVSTRDSSRFSFKRSRDQEWFVSYSEELDFNNIDKLQRDFSVETRPAPAVSPGPFTAEIDAFDLSTSAASKQSVFDSIADYRKHIKSVSGIRIYRDGFGVRVDRDWLGLGKQWTAASSYYGLKPENTLGYVAISASENAALVETTDREGFKDTPAFRNFLRLFEIFVSFAEDSQAFLRRGWLDFKRENERKLAEVSPTASPQLLAESVSSGLKRVASYHQSITSTQTQVSNAAEQSEAAVKQLASNAAGNPTFTKQCRDLQNGLRTSFREVQDLLEKVKLEVSQASQLYGVQKVVEGQIAELNTQLLEGVQVMSLGLTTEVLSHEIANVCDQMLQKTHEITKHLRLSGVVDVKILAYVEYINQATNGLRKQLSHIDPSLKYARNKRRILELKPFLTDIMEYHNARWKGKSISMVVEATEAMSVKINQGVLTQVLDNLILNSEYWIREDLAAGRIDFGLVTIRLAPPHLIVYDNGFGIDPKVESLLFDPFISCKKNGRGLGLFVSRQLLDSEGCKIRLKPRRNGFKRLFQFEIDLSECIQHDD